MVNDITSNHYCNLRPTKYELFSGLLFKIYIVGYNTV